MRASEAILASMLLVACETIPAAIADASAAVADAAQRLDADSPRDASTPLDAAPADASALADASAPPDASVSPDASTPSDASTSAEPTPINVHRDRLIDGMAADAGATRCAIWSAFDPVQRGVFLTITDLLGQRSWLSEDPVGPRMGADLAMALDHVERFVAVLGTLDCSRPQCCGGAGHRVFFVADEALIAALRDTNAGLPMWGSSLDLAGPHEPFTADSETSLRQPTGQAHYFGADGEAVLVEHVGITPLLHPRLVEIDIDYNIIHDSNPVCEYAGGTTGFDRWEMDWSSAGAGGRPDFGYVPTGCQ